MTRPIIPDGVERARARYASERRRLGRAEFVGGEAGRTAGLRTDPSNRPRSVNREALLVRRPGTL